MEGITITQEFHSSATGIPVGYIIRLEDGIAVYHAGDTGIFDSMRLLGKLYPLDLAILSVGGVFTMGLYQAVETITLLKPKRVVPMHYNTFPILEQTPDKSVAQARYKVPEAKIIVLKSGQEYQF